MNGHRSEERRTRILTALAWTGLALFFAGLGAAWVLGMAWAGGL